MIKNKTIILSVLFLILLILSFLVYKLESNTSQETMNPNNISDNAKNEQTITDEELGIEFKIPSNWFVRQHNLKFQTLYIYPEPATGTINNDYITIWKDPNNFEIDKTLVKILTQKIKKINGHDWQLIKAQEIQYPQNTYYYATLKLQSETIIIVTSAQGLLSVRDNMLATIKLKK